MPYDNTIAPGGAALAYLDLAQSPIKSSASTRQFMVRNLNQYSKALMEVF